MNRFAVLHAGSPADHDAWQARHQPEHLQAWPGLTLAWWGRDFCSCDGRMRGAWCGALTDDHALADRLSERGVPALLHDHGQLAIDEVALAGPDAPSAWRWQGSMAVAHVAQRRVLAVRDPMGVGGLHASRIGLASDAELLDDAAPVPPGVVAVVAPGQRRWQRLKLQPTARPWLREVPDDLRRTGADEAMQGVLARVHAAAMACARGLDGLARTAPTDAAEHWWAQRLVWPTAPSAGGLWTWAGAASLLGASVTTAPWSPSPAVADLPEREVPEPVADLPAGEVTRRRWRATWLPERDLALDRGLAAAQGRVLVAPHLDVAVLAWLGALAEDVRPWLP
jgi:hypothetical protein